MLYIKSLVLDKFKSFKHANLFLSKGYTAVVGPNGSGKSNICDAILFCLGESSLRRLRANKLDDLISSQKGKKSDLARAYVKMELGGDEDITLTRGLRSDGKTVYTLNGKRMTRQEVLAVLAQHGVYADERNTIAQGEIGRITSLNPRERRELIEMVAGIDDFEHKKEEALREFEKVNVRIGEAQVMLNERSGFLKELEKEKEAAEKYLSMTSRLKSLNYSILMVRLESARSAHKGYSVEFDEVSHRRKDVEKRSAELAKKIEAIDKERQELTAKLQASSKGVGAINNRLQEISGLLADASARITNCNATIAASGKTSADLEKEVSEAEATIKRNDGEIAISKSRLEGAEKELLNLGKLGEKELEAGKKVEELEAKLASLEKEREEAQEKLNAINSELAARSSRKEAAAQELGSSGRLEQIQKELARSINRSKAIDHELDEKSQYIREMERDFSAKEKAVGALETMLLNLKEQRAMARPSGISMTLSEKIKGIFTEKDGFFGSVAELCTYDDAYAVAVEAAAGARMNYFVVDTIATADNMISYIRKNELGRATFIPLSDVVDNDRGARDGAGLMPILRFVRYDERFARAFSYVFSNTYVAESLAQAKSKGVGARRYVTLSGELLEPSGIVSGGSRSRMIAVASVEKSIRETSEEISTQRAVCESIHSTLYEERKLFAALEGEANMLAESMVNLQAEETSLKRKHADMQSAYGVDTEQVSRLMEEQKAAATKKAELDELVASAGAELHDTYENAVNKSLQMVKHGAAGADVEKLEALKKEIESIKIKSAELRKENQMLAARRDESRARKKEDEDAAKAAAEQLRAAQAESKELAAEKAKIENEIKSSSATTKVAYERMSALDSEMLKLGKDTGEVKANMGELDRLVNDLTVKKSQIEVRINDLTAELSAYDKDGTTFVDSELESMEKESGILGARIAELGTVNMKAPEIYEQKKKDVAEVDAKLETLETERRAVLGLMDEIDKKKLNTFLATFEAINKNFSEMYNYVFPGKATLELEEENDPFNSGLGIRVSNGKASKRLDALSGGEKSLISMMLLFAIHRYKPASVYLLDEVDATLDRENSKKLSLLIKEMSKGAQFVVVSHNDSLISGADVAIGVVKTNDESKVVGIEVARVQKGE